MTFNFYHTIIMINYKYNFYTNKVPDIKQFIVVFIIGNGSNGCDEKSRPDNFFIERKHRGWKCFQKARLKTTSELVRWLRYNHKESKVGWNHGNKLSSLVVGNEGFLLYNGRFPCLIKNRCLFDIKSDNVIRQNQIVGLKEVS